MNREIKFRIWHKKKAAWISDEVYLDPFESTWDWYDNDKRPILNNNHIIAEQFTGLKDKNGKEIYEGDIVTCRALITTETVLVKDIRKIPVQISAWPTAYGKGRGECEVIGNIHENPELLGEK